MLHGLLEKRKSIRRSALLRGSKSAPAVGLLPMVRAITFAGAHLSIGDDDGDVTA
jgi:hypothetical protein